MRKRHCRPHPSSLLSKKGCWRKRAFNSQVVIRQTAQKENIFTLHISYMFLLNKNVNQFIFILFKSAYLPALFLRVCAVYAGSCYEFLKFFLCWTKWWLAVSKHNSLSQLLDLKDFQIQILTLKVSLIILMELITIYVFFKSCQLSASLRVTTVTSLTKETSTLTPKHLIKCYLTHPPHTFHSLFLRIFATKKSSCLG